MRKEDFVVSLERVNFHAPVVNVDYASTVSARSQETRNNLLRYLGEYRLAVKFDEFYYKEGCLAGERFLAGEENFPIIQKFKKAIYKKEKEGANPEREIAECAGFQKIEEAYLRGEDFLFLWISPPGSKEEGYGDYSFTFIGEVRDRRIRVIPYRNNLSLNEHREVASIFSQRAEFFKTDIDFLANPVFIQKKEGLKKAEDVLLRIGEKEKIDLSWRERLEQKVGGLIEMFIDALRKNASDAELNRIKWSMENFTLETKDEIITGKFNGLTKEIDNSKILDIFGRYAPPPVAGSCPSSSKTLSELHSTLNKNRGYEFDHQGVCAICHSGPKALGPCEICEECVIKIEEKEKWGITV